VLPGALTAHSSVLGPRLSRRSPRHFASRCYPRARRAPLSDEPARYVLPYPLTSLRLQCFGEKDTEEEFSEADLLTAVKFDDSGDYLATGDKGGRVVIFERVDAPKVSDRRRGGVQARPAAAALRLR
jgi:hypothetical protein